MNTLTTVKPTANRIKPWAAIAILALLVLMGLSLLGGHKPSTGSPGAVPTTTEAPLDGRGKWSGILPQRWAETR